MKKFLIIAFLFLLPSVSYAAVCTNNTSAQNDASGLDGNAIGTQFTPSMDCYITDVKMLFRKRGSPPPSINMYIFSDSAGVPSVTVLSTSAAILAASLTTSFVTTDFVFDGTVKLSSGVQYWFVLPKSTANVNDTYVIPENTAASPNTQYANPTSNDPPTTGSWTTINESTPFEVDGNTSGPGGSTLVSSIFSLVRAILW